MEIAELRNWITLALAVCGFVITFRTYVGGQKQRRIENSFRMVTLFREALQPKDMERWEEVFHATSEPAGASYGHMVSYDEEHGRSELPISALFTEGPYDDGAVERMAEVFDLIAREALDGTVDLRIIYFQLGQLMDSIHGWLKSMDDAYDGKSFLDFYYPSFNELYTREKIKAQWPSRTYAHIG